MKTRIFIGICVITLICTTMIGCGKKSLQTNNLDYENEEAGKSNSDVHLTVWSGEVDSELITQIADDFIEANSSEANITIEWQAMEEGDCRSAYLNDVLNGPDVYTITDGEVRILAAGGAAMPVENADEIKEKNLEESVNAVTEDNTVYAYPLTADNSYFLYYNKAYFSDEDVKSLDKMLEIAAANNKKFAMDWSSGWYLYSFFSQTGLQLSLNEDGVTNICNWNSSDGSIKGIDVAQAMAAIAAHPGFKSENQDEWTEDIQDGNVIAFVSGVWDENFVASVWGNNYGAAKLPTYKCAGVEVQMGSFFGYKVVGVNPYSENIEWAQRFADFISNEENQKLRFDMRGQAPANINAAQSDEVQKALAVQAVLKQSEFSQMQRVGANYWSAATDYGNALVSGSYMANGLQELLNKTVEAITSSVVQ